MIYYLNNAGLDELKKRRKENLKIFIGFPLFFIAYLCLSYISMRGSLFFWASLPIFLLLFVFIGIISPTIAAKKFGKVISKLTFEDSRINLSTEKVNFIKGKTINILDTDYELAESKSIQYGNGKTSGLIIKTKGSGEYFLIEIFFDEFEEIKNRMKR
ncbi:hypothetical protein TBC1_111512 [Lentimicrobium saccharophilum]|uniref:Protein containing bacterial PH domain n=1 Tax=Lentimicrobium saccharophilum TaxID=1678841 RepID=A0A0S7BXZ5_9BACT|nr:hypothetical protein [Lentimicrobium saccharophilum]GAP43351.1 hypothetical protein TBC1_111504 [Lentimicrobium saccharophilum]GAP43359.1 hypothetical protein TBC1_111512 [Lentimicrobium saccharophilum]